jgi:arylsulfatase
MFINDQKVGEARIENTCPSRFGAETFDVGMDNGSPVSESYQAPFAYGGTIKKVEITITPSPLNAGDIQKIRNAERSAVMAIE